MATKTSPTYEAVEWLSDPDCLRYADYWNDEEEERRKPFWVLDGDFSRMKAYLKEIGLPAQMEEADLGAGTLWAVPDLFRLGAVDHVYCVEYSRHRLLKLGPAVLDHYGVSSDRVTLALGDVHQLRLTDKSLDFVFLSVAFHHSDKPAALLSEIPFVLAPSSESSP
jgi:ubiquinone/menaquinone biosynthesis C-methylase UbiE